VKVLVIDDEEDARDLLRRVLEECGAEVLTRGDAETGVSAFSEFGPQLVISDIGMPETDGYEVIRRIRRAELLGEQVKAIALTAFARHEDRAKALEAGFDEHVAKPAEPLVLIQKARELLGR